MVIGSAVVHRDLPIKMNLNVNRCLSDFCTGDNEDDDENVHRKCDKSYDN